MHHRNIIVVGDSLARGHADETGSYDWPHMMLPQIAKHLKTRAAMVNLSIGGMTSLRVIEHFKAVARDIDHVAAIVFAFGANDIKHSGPDRYAPFMIEPASREGIWRDGFGFAQAVHPHIPVFAVGVMPVNPLVYENADIVRDTYRCNDDVVAYNAELEAVCVDMGVHFIDAHISIERLTPWVDRLMDGVHPDAIGQGLLAQAIFTGMRLHLPSLG